VTVHSAGTSLSFSANGGHHPARARKATMAKTVVRVLGVHCFVTAIYSNRILQQGCSICQQM
jgi:hypothetical protein